MPDRRFGVVCYYYEYTQRLEYEAKLRENDAKLRQADRAKDEFLAMLGHEACRCSWLQ